MAKPIVNRERRVTDTVRERDRDRKGRGNVRSLHFPLARLVDLSLMKSTHTEGRRRNKEHTHTQTGDKKQQQIGKIKQIAVGFLTLASTVCSLSFVPSKHF